MHKLLFLYVLVKAIRNERKLNLKGQLIQNGHQYAFSDQYYIAAGTQVFYKFQRAKMFLYWFIYSLITVRFFTVVYQTGACSCECCMLSEVVTPCLNIAPVWEATKHGKQGHTIVIEKSFFCFFFCFAFTSLFPFAMLKFTASPWSVASGWKINFSQSVPLVHVIGAYLVGKTWLWK